MRTLYPDNQQTQEIFNRDDNRATKQDIQDLSLQIAETNQTLQNTINALSNLSDSLADSLNTNEVTAINASINMLEAATSNLQSANIFNLTVEELATFKQLTTDLATVAQNLTVGGDVAITGDIQAKNATFDKLTATSATIANWTIDNLTTNTIDAVEVNVSDKSTTKDLEVTDTATIKDANITNADIDDADITKADVEEATVALAKIDEVAIENIHWKDYQVYTADSSKLFMVLPHFENGIYFLRAKDGNQNTLFAVEVHNSVDNLFARWSQKEMNWVYKISKVGTGPNTQCMLEVHNVDNVAFNLEYATICATPNVPAPTTYTEQPFPGNPMYKVSHQDGNKFFQNVDLANEGTTGAGLTMYATSNWALATTYYNYDGTMGVMSYNYLPNQSLNTGDNVEFYNLTVHGFSTENLNVPGTLKAKHIYDGPALTAEEKAALPDDTLLIEEGQTSGEVPLVYALSDTLEPTTMANFFCPEDKRWKWSTNFEGCAAGGNLEEEYPGVTIDYFDYTTGGRLTAKIGSTSATMQAKVVAQRQSDHKEFVVFEAATTGPSSMTGLLDVTEIDNVIGPNGFIDPMMVTYRITKPSLVPVTSNVKVFDMNGDVMTVPLFNSQLEQVGFRFYVGETFEDSETYTVTSLSFPIYATNLKYSTASGGAAIISRKTTKDGAVQIKPLVPFNDDGTSATDARPLVYDRTSDTIKKATGDLVLPRDVDIGRDLTVEGDITGHQATLNNVHAEDMILTGDLEVENDAMFRHDVSISGDLYVDGVEHINDSETTQSSGDYMILRHNNPIPLGTGEKSGIAVHNYKSGGTATLSVDSEGTWRLADNTATSTMHTNLYYYDGHYYDTSFVEQTFVDQIKTAFDEDEIGDCVFYNSDSFYHFDGTHWYAVTLVNNKLVTDETEVTDAALITALEALTKGPLQYFRKLEITTINELENEAIFTRDEEANMTDKALVQWDAATSKAKTIPLPTMNNQALTAQIGTNPGIDTSLVKIGDNYYTEYPDMPYTDTVPADATFTPEPNELNENDHYWYSPSEDKCYVEDSTHSKNAIGVIYWDDTIWTVLAHPEAIPADIVEIPMPTTGHYYKAPSTETTYQWKSNVGGGGLSFVGTRAQYNVAKLIPEGQDGYIGPNTLVTITDEDDYIEGDER